MLTFEKKTRDEKKNDAKAGEAAKRDTQVATPEQQQLVRELVLVWLDFERKLGRVPVIAQIEAGKATLEDYLILLRNLRQQVMEGSRWITRAASSFEVEYAELRSKIIKHAWDEHRDYEMLERDYVRAGGELADIQSEEKNIGSEALSAFMFHQASQPNPVDLLGAMFIIEGLGNKMAGKWAENLQQQLDLPDNAISFLKYHGKADDKHIGELEEILLMPIINATTAPRILKTAKVVARLYMLQLEETK